MRIESAMYASREGLAVHGAAISVIGDNISNANTTGFKQSRTEFQDILADGPSGYQSEVVASPGNGVQISNVRTIFTAGGMDATGRPLDLSIDGNGYFIVGDETDRTYTRAGAFQRDPNGFLVTPEGNFVQGYQGSVDPASGTLTNLNLNQIDTTGRATSTATLTGNIDSSLIAKSAAPSAPATFNALNAAASFTNSLSVYDSLGAKHDAVIAFTKTGTNTWVAQAYMDGSDIQGGTAGQPVQIGANVNITFGSNGTVDAANQALAAISAQNVTYSNGSAAGNFTVNVGQFTQYSAGSLVNSVTQDGQSIGNPISYEVRKDGQIYAQLDSGSFAKVGTIATAKFTNEDGLKRAGSSAFSATTESGIPEVGAANTDGRGAMKSGSLEQSNVDIASEFVNLVVFQRGYQANSQTMSVTSQILRDTIGLMR